MNIIFVDDEFSAISNFLENIIDNIDINYKMFNTNPLDCLSYARQQPLDAAFLDINIPECSGLELAKQLIAIQPTIKIIFVSGYEQNEEEIINEYKNNVLGFCNKPYKKDLLLSYIARINSTSNKSIEIKCFNGFDVYVNSIHVKFNSAKSKELLSLLVDRCGQEVEMTEAIALLWQDKDCELAKKLYRDAVFRLRLTLKAYGISNIVDFGRGKLAIVTSGITCDYWNINDLDTLVLFNAKYMLPSYEWAIDTQIMIENLYSKHFTRDFNIE